MHEDPAPEIALLQPGHRVACVLSAGDMAFSLLKSGACHVTAADVNPAQHALARMKLALHAQGWSLSDAALSDVTQALRNAGHEAWVRDGDRDLLGAAKYMSRPLLAAGDIDLRLRILARWIAPWVLPPATDERRFGRLRWRAPWYLLGTAIRMVFPRDLRLHLPADLGARVKQRMESRLAASDAADNPWLQRLLQPQPWTQPEVLKTSWPAQKSPIESDVLCLHEGPLDASSAPLPFHLISASNIFDASSPDTLRDFLMHLQPCTTAGSLVVVRSLFRDAGEWAAPPAGWEVDREQTSQAQALDQAPLCRVSVVMKRVA
ncbi:DUF3419 family protein [Roseimicrobium sp. ORNL1]|nr:DUF3419 family protein [Roseimicrobium sp. ORNL1]